MSSLLRSQEILITPTILLALMIPNLPFGISYKPHRRKILDAFLLISCAYARAIDLT